MSVTLHWFLPTSGDSRTVSPLGETPHFRAPDLGYLAEVARAAERLGFEAVLTPTGTHCLDAWVVTAALIPQTTKLKFLVAFRPGLVSPTLAAQQAGAFQALSGGRLLLNIVTGGSDDEQQRFGDWLDHDARYARTDEFLQILKGSWSESPFFFAGDHYRVAGATVSTRPDPIPPLYFGGASPAAEGVAARRVDVYLAWGEPPRMVAPRLERMRGLAAAVGRSLRFGIRLHVIARETSEEAWAETDRFMKHLTPDTIARAQRSMAKTQSVGQQRMIELHNGRADDLVVAPNLWAGYGLIRGEAGTTLVGSYAEVADRIGEYHSLGFEEFILSGYPHLEEAHWFAEGVMPLLRERALLAGLQPSQVAPPELAAAAR